MCDNVAVAKKDWYCTSQGCVLSHCSGETLEPFCNIPRGSGSVTVTDCTFDHLSVGVCNLVQFNSALPSEFQVCVHYCWVCICAIRVP